MSSNESDRACDPALRRAEAARDAVAEAVEGYLERLAVAGGTVRTDLDADLRAAGRLMARNTHRQLAANLTLVRRMMEARSVPAMLQIQQDFLRRQTEWAMHDLERMGAQVLDLLAEGQGAARSETGSLPPAPVPPPETGSS